MPRPQATESGPYEGLSERRLGSSHEPLLRSRAPRTLTADKGRFLEAQERWWWGLSDHIRHWADRLAEAGYAALAVDLYGGETATTPDEAMALMQAVDEEAAIATMGAGHEFLFATHLR